MDNKKIAIIGSGNLGRSIAEGLVEKKVFSERDIILTKRNLSSLEDLGRKGFELTSDNAEATSNADIILLCVQPNQLENVLQGNHSPDV